MVIRAPRPESLDRRGMVWKRRSIERPVRAGRMTEDAAVTCSIRFVLARCRFDRHV